MSPTARFQHLFAHLALVFGCVVAPAPVVAIDVMVRLDLPSGPLSQSLLLFGEQAELSLVFPKAAVAGLSGPAVRGEFARDKLSEIFDKLLASHCFSYEFVTKNVVSIRPGCLKPLPPPTPSKPPATTARPAAAPPPSIEEVLVRAEYLTGSRIRNTALASPTPVDIIDRAEIARSGKQSLSELLRYLPAVSGNSTSTLVTNGGDGSATVTLRGLPASNTLVLLNGRRINPDAFRGAAVNLNTLPLVLVERVEVLKDGASSIYGSDAVAGVVNIVTREDVEGVSFSAYLGNAAQRDLETVHLNLAGGYRSDRLNLVLGASYYDQNGIFSRERAVSESADDRDHGGIDKRSSATSPARVSLGGSALILADGLNGTDPAHFRPASSEDRFEYRDVTSLIVPSRRASGFGSLSYRMTNTSRIFLDALVTRTNSLNTLAPTPIFTGFETLDLTVAQDNPFNPFGRDIRDVRRRITELPPRLQQNQTFTARYAAGFEGEWGRTHVELALQHNETRAREAFNNGLDGVSTQLALGPNCQAPCVPLNLFGPPGSITGQMLDYLTRDTISKGRSRYRSITADVDFPIFEHRAGTVEVASGIEFRRESLSTHPDSVFGLGGTIGGVNFGPTNAERDVLEAYLEVLVPVVRNRPWAKLLDLHLSGRISDYDGFGTTKNPKLALRYKPSDSWMIRGSMSRGFRAPTLSQLFISNTTSLELLNDPCGNPDAVGRLPGCAQQSDLTRIEFLTTNGGNPNLKPETSRNRAIGLVFTPRPFEMSLDYYWISQRNVVDRGAQFILDQNAEFLRFADNVTRDENGNLAAVSANLLNLGSRDVRGVDVTLRYGWEVGSGSNFDLRLNATHINSYRDKFNPTLESREQAGKFTDEASEGNGALPHWKASLGLNWQKAYWQAQYDVHFVSSIDEQIPLLGTERTLEPWFVHNLQFSYDGPLTGWFSVALGVNNALDEAPPFSAAAFNDSHDSRTYDATGRYWYLKIGKSL